MSPEPPESSTCAAPPVSARPPAAKMVPGRRGRRCWRGRSEWTRRVPHPVRIGHSASLTPYKWTRRVPHPVRAGGGAQDLEHGLDVGGEVVRGGELRQALEERRERAPDLPRPAAVRPPRAGVCVCVCVYVCVCVCV